MMITRGVWRTAALGAIFALAACESNTYVEPPPPKVTVATPHIREVTDYLNFTGTLVASEQAEVRARVSGILQSMHFEPGSVVEEGDLLFIIEPAEYEADLQAAKAELAGARSHYERASIEYERARKLFQKKAGAEAEVVKWRVEREISSAEILRAEARVERAELDLGYTQVSAPISGRVGRNEVDIGNLVGEGEATLLSEITRYHPIHLYFNLNERDLLRVREEAAEAGDSTADTIAVPVFMGLANEEGFPHEGRLDFAESGLDTETGTIQLRAAFNNDARPPLFLPGLFARVRMPLGTRPDLPLVSERAIGQDQSGRYLLIVNAEDAVEKVNVTTGQKIDGLVVIEEGVRKTDRVIVKGLQRARPGRKVNPEAIDMQMLTESALREAAEAQARQAAPPADTAATTQEAP